MRALIIIDVQLMYDGGQLSIVHPPLATSLANIARAMDAATAAGVPVVVVQQLHGDMTLEQAGGTEWELHPALAGHHVDLLLTKRMPSAFAGTLLGQWLVERGVRVLTLAGYMTHHCVESTARDAMHRGYQVEVLSDATGSPHYANAAGSVTARTMHTVSLVTMHGRFAGVADTATWLDALAAGRVLSPASPRRCAADGAAAQLAGAGAGAG